MKSYTYKNDKFTDRLTSSANAKAALLEKFRNRPGPDDPAVIARKAEQAAIDEARERRAAERRAAREAEQARLAAEQRALEETRLAEERARKAEEALRAAQRAAEAKAARDARYAARRARRDR